MYRIGTASQSLRLATEQVEIRALPRGASRALTDEVGNAVPPTQRGSYRDTATVTGYGPTGMLAGDLLAAVRLPEEKRQEIQKTNDGLKALIAAHDANRAAASKLTIKDGEKHRQNAAISIAKIREAIHRDRLIGIIDPKAAVQVARSYATLTRMNAESFASANDALTENENANIANLRPVEHGEAKREVQIEAAEVTVKTGEAGFFALSQAAVAQAVEALDKTELSNGGGHPQSSFDPRRTGPEDLLAVGERPANARPQVAKPTDADDKEPLYEIKAVALRVREDAEASDVYDDRGIEPEIKVILDGRQKRREEDAATVKNLVLILRDINLMIRIAAKAAEKKGVNDGEFQAGLAQAQEAYGGAVAATARAAMPLAESGIDINPDVLIGAPPRPADAPSTLDEPSRRLA